VKRRRRKYWIGFDLGGTKMLAAVFNSDFKVIGQSRKKTKGHEGVKAGLERMKETIRMALKEAGVPARQVAGIGVGCPGPLHLDRGLILDTPNLGWKNVPIAAVLEKALGCPAVIANDVDAGVYGEYRFGAGRKGHCVLGVFPGTGIGGGCVYDGEMIRGRTGSCLEIGHLMVQPGGPRCGCGQNGCLEAVASRLAISSAAAPAAYRGEAPHLLELAGTDLAEIRSSTLAAAIDAGDHAVEDIVRQAARWIGRSVGGVINLLAPDIIVLGGGLVEAMPGLFRKEVEDAARQSAMKAFRKSFKVAVARLGDYATVTGAAAWAEHITR
jgi:glucokinase